MPQPHGRKVLVLDDVHENVRVELPGWWEDATKDELQMLRIGIQAAVDPPSYYSLLTVNEAAEELQLSPAKVRRAIAGKLEGATPLPAIRLGRTLLVRRSALLAWEDRLAERGVTN